MGMLHSIGIKVEFNSYKLSSHYYLLYWQKFAWTHFWLLNFWSWKNPQCEDVSDEKLWWEKNLIIKCKKRRNSKYYLHSYYLFFTKLNLQIPPTSAVFVNRQPWSGKCTWALCKVMNLFLGNFIFPIWLFIYFFPSELVTWRPEGGWRGYKITEESISGRVMKMHFSSPTEMLFGRVKWLISHIYRSSPKAATSHSQGAPVSNKTGGCNKMSKQQHVLYVNKSLEVKPEHCRIWAAPLSHQVKVTEYFRTVETQKKKKKGRRAVWGVSYTLTHRECVCLHK